MKELCSCLFFHILEGKGLSNEEIERLAGILTVVEPVVHLFLLYLCFLFFQRDLEVLSASQQISEYGIQTLEGPVKVKRKQK